MVDEQNWSADDGEQEIETLIRLSQRGDRDAFMKLCELRRERLVSEVRSKIDRRLLPRVDASDIIQEVFIDANRRFAEVAGNDVPPIAWLRFLCNQKITDMQRFHIGARKRSVQREQPRPGPRSTFDLHSIASKLVAQLTSPSMKAHRHEIADRVTRLLGELSPLDREVLVLRHFDGMSNTEVADSLGLGVNAASNRYVRALKRFKKVLEFDEDTGVDRVNDPEKQ